MADTTTQQPTTQSKEILGFSAQSAGRPPEIPVPGGAITNFGDSTPKTEVAQPLEPQGIVARGIGKVTPIVSVENVFGASGLQTDATTVGNGNSQLDTEKQLDLTRQQILAQALGANR